MIKIGVIGCGHWGPNHIRVLHRDIKGCGVKAVADLKEENLSPITDRYPDIETTLHPEEIFTDSDIGAVVIATPTSTHADLVEKALQRGKHVLCEKPLCISSSRACELSTLAEDRKRVLMTGLIFLYNSGIIKVRELVEDDELGEINYISSTRTNLGPIRKDTNVAVDLATHDVSIFNWILDSTPEQVSAVGGQYLQSDHEDVAFVQLTYPDGILANVHASWLNPQKVRRMTVVGSDRMVTWDDQTLNTPISIYEKGVKARPTSGDYGEFLQFAMWDEEVRMPRIEMQEPLKVQDQAFIDAIEKGVSPRTGPWFSTQVVEVLDAINRSLQQDGHPVSVDS